MKKTAIISLSLLMSFSAFAKSVSEALEDYQNSFSPSSSDAPGATPAREAAVRSTGAVAASAANLSCDEDNETTLPLKRLMQLMQSRSPALKFDHDPRAGILTVSSPNIIGNCASMLDWTMEPKVINGTKSYVIAVKFKKGSDCQPDGSCTYSVTKADGTSTKTEKMVFKPTLDGFDKCMVDSGAVKGDAVDPNAVYPARVSYPFEGVTDTGNVLFAARGKPSSKINAKFGDWTMVNGCDFYENPATGGVNVSSAADIDAKALSDQAAALRTCPANEYQKVADFVDRNEKFAGDLANVRDRLIKEEAQKVAKNITDGKFNEEDAKILEDFEKYILQPKIDRIKQLYAELQGLQGDARTAKQQELNAARAELAAYNNAPYFVAAQVQKLLTIGNFEGSTSLFGIRAEAAMYSKLGTKVDNVDVTLDNINVQISRFQVEFSKTVVDEKEKYAVRTGQTTGLAQSYVDRAQQLRDNQTTRTANYRDEMRTEIARTVQGGYCYVYNPNPAKCIADSQLRVKELAEELAKKNDVDAKRAVEMDTKAQDYAKLERQGREYVAKQNGETVPAESTEDALTPSRRAASVTTTASAPTNPQASYGGNQQQQMFQQQQQAMLAAQMQQWSQYGQQQSQYPQMGQQQMGFNGAPTYLGAQYGQQQGYNPMMMGGQFGAQFGGQQGYNPMMMGGQYGQAGYSGAPTYLGGQYGQQQGYNPYGMQQGYNPMMAGGAGYGAGFNFYGGFR
jgi:hypothetical protein